MELDLSYNNPGEKAVKLLRERQEDPHCGLKHLSLEPGGAQWLKKGLMKYSCQLTIDTNTVSRKLKLSEDNRKATRVEELQPHSDHPDRFDGPHLLCATGLTGRCYWEVEWERNVRIAMSYRGIRRRGGGDDCMFGFNNQSWSLSCSDCDGYSAWHNKIGTPSSFPSSPSSSPLFSSPSSSSSNKVAVYLDRPAGTLSFYKVSSGSLIHLHTFNHTFTEDLYAGFTCWTDSSVTLGNI